MKVLFAVSNENISAQIVKKYQKDYKEIISYKNMYYFNAVVKELQRDKSYDRIVIGEDLEPFSNNNYDAIDKFIFEKLDSISDEATGSEGDIPIILICSDRRAKSDPMLVKLFGLGIYNALLGQDRSIDNVCKMLNRPRSKKDAKVYYKIESDEVNYESEKENTVSEVEIKNILAHYKRLGKDEDRYVESFNNIAAQYNDAQLRIITKCLPIGVRAVLEEKSPKYQSVMTFGDVGGARNKARGHEEKKSEGLKIGFLNGDNRAKPSKPVIVPTAVNTGAAKKYSTPAKARPQARPVPQVEPQPAIEDLGFEDIDATVNMAVPEAPTMPEPIMEPVAEPIVEEPVQPVKRGRGRPRKNPVPTEQPAENKPKRGRGRPRKNPLPEETAVKAEDLVSPAPVEEATLPGFDTPDTTTLPGFEPVEENTVLPGFDDIEDTTTLPGFDDIEEPTNQNTSMPGFHSVAPEPMNSAAINTTWGQPQATQSVTDYTGDDYYARSNSGTKVASLLSKDKKVVAFVGTTKNGTSFLVNNLGKTLANMGIKTAILDLTTNRNSYYIFTNNDEKLRGVAYESIKKLRSGIASGISADRNLDVYTALPGDTVPLEDVDNILSTLVQNYSLVLMDCDFGTPVQYFDEAQEIYVVQSLDILTIQPMTAFMRELKAQDILKEEKIRVVINKEVKVRGLTPKAILGGLAFYNDPSMSFMTELFNKDTVQCCTIPFDEATYIKYLENVMDCEITTNGYSKEFNTKLKELANMVYPLIGKYKPPVSNNSYGNYGSNRGFSSNMNNTLEQMKRKF